MTRSIEILSTLMLLAVLAATANAQEFQSLFNGTDLSGWAGKTEFWSVSAVGSEHRSDLI